MLAGLPSRLLIDCGVTDNFMDADFARRHNIATMQHQDRTLQIRLGDGLARINETVWHQPKALHRLPLIDQWPSRTHEPNAYPDTVIV
jgi:hypothetical protein